MTGYTRTLRNHAVKLRTEAVSIERLIRKILI